MKRATEQSLTDLAETCPNPFMILIIKERWLTWWRSTFDDETSCPTKPNN